MAKIITQEKLDFNNAVEMATLRIHNELSDYFFITTEFGVIGIEIFKEITIKPDCKRVDVSSWRLAPATKFVAMNRNKKVDFYIEIHVRGDLLRNKVTQGMDLTRVEVAKGMAMCILCDLDNKDGLPISLKYGDKDVDLLVYMWNKVTLHNGYQISPYTIAKELILTRYPSIVQGNVMSRNIVEIINLTEKYLSNYSNEILAEYQRSSHANVWNEYKNFRLVGNMFYATLLALFIKYNGRNYSMYGACLEDYLGNVNFVRTVADRISKDAPITPYRLINRMIKKSSKLIVNNTSADQFITGCTEEKPDSKADAKAESTDKGKSAEKPPKKGGARKAVDPIKKTPTEKNSGNGPEDDPW